MEERSEFRRPTIKSASSLSISAEQAFPSPVILSGGRRSGSGDARFEGEYQSMSSALCASAPSHPLHVMPPRITRNSDRPRASDRTMVDTEDTRTRLPMFPDSTGVVTLSRGTLQGWKTNQSKSKTSRANRGAHLQQWAGRRDKNLLALRSRGAFFLDIPFYRTH